MAYNGSGVFTRLYSWVDDRDNGVKIRADRMDAEFDGIATGLSTAILKDGTQTITADIPWNGNKITGLGDPTSAQDAATKAYVDGLVGTEFADNVFRIQDNGDATKEFAFEVSAITTGTTRTWTIPDADITFGAYAPTLLNVADEAGFKSAVNLEADTDYVAVDGSLVSLGDLDIVAGDIVYGSGADTVARLAKGTDGQFLTLASGVPAWADLSSSSVDFQVFESSGTWTKPTGASFVYVVLIGGGGGGGSGARYSSVDHGGGGGGEGGGVSISSFPADSLSATETVTVGAGGSGGAAVTTNDTGGNAAADGGDSSFGDYIKALGGDGGSGGAGSGGSGGSGEGLGTETTTGGNAGGVGSANSSVQTQTGDISYPLGGCGGGGINSSNIARNHLGYSASAITASTFATSSTTEGGDGDNATYLHGYVWTGGGGGASGLTMAGGAGGDGNWGSGGGGGGASLNGYNSGAGGAGGDGVVIVVSYLGA